MTVKLPKGFEASGVHCGLKQDPAKEDLALLHCPQSAVAVGVYTQNLVFAAPVELDRERTPTDQFRVLVVNSGNANACTGRRGREDTERMAQLAANSVGAETEQALVMSTGIIGEFLPMERIANGITAAGEQLGESPDHVTAAARGFLTTDRGMKAGTRQVALGDETVTVTVIAKGAGMIGPRMATMLAVVVTDARLEIAAADKILRDAVDASFNRISVDGHTSTNDTVLLLASGQGQGDICSGDELDELSRTVTELCVEIAKMIPDDGEGASHLIEVRVRGAANEFDADKIARTVGDSPLVKTAISGADPNWGRIVSAAGCAGAAFDPNQLSLSVQSTPLYADGEPLEFDAAEVSGRMRATREVLIELSVGAGSGEAVYWASDLTCDYVTFNADYHT